MADELVFNLFEWGGDDFSVGVVVTADCSQYFDTHGKLNTGDCCVLFQDVTRKALRTGLEFSQQVTANDNVLHAFDLDAHFVIDQSVCQS